MKELKDSNKTSKKTEKKVTAKKKEKTIVGKEVKEDKPKRKTVKKTEVKSKPALDKKEQKCYRVLSTILYILTKVGRICLMIFVPFIFLAAIILPIIFQKIEIDGNVVKINDLNIVSRDDSISIKLGDNVSIIECDTTEFDQVIAFMSENSKGVIILVTEIFLLLFGSIIVLYIYLFEHLEKLFSNFINQKKPFNDENVNYLYKIVILLFVIKVVDICLPFSNSLSMGIFEIFIAFIIYILFKYATCIQNKSDIEIYE